LVPPVGLRQGQATAEWPKSPWPDLKCSESIGKCRRYTAPKEHQTRIGGFKSATAHDVEQGEAEPRHDIEQRLRRGVEDYTELRFAAPALLRSWRDRKRGRPGRRAFVSAAMAAGPALPASPAVMWLSIAA
jgi:hypothetical protein